MLTPCILLWVQPQHCVLVVQQQTQVRAFTDWIQVILTNPFV